MPKHIESPADFQEALDNGPWAWPGGYPLFFVTSDGAALSYESAKDNAHLVKRAILERDKTTTDQWDVVFVDVNWEDVALYCEHSNERIPCAYGDERE